MINEGEIPNKGSLIRFDSRGSLLRVAIHKIKDHTNSIRIGTNTSWSKCSLHNIGIFNEIWSVTCYEEKRVFRNKP